jgi:hypothetical protein
MSTMTLLLIVCILLTLGAHPRWPYSRNWGYYPMSSMGVVVIVLLFLLLEGRI